MPKNSACTARTAWSRSSQPITQLTFISDVGLVSAARPPGADMPGPGGAASLDHALWLHRPVDPHEWHLYEAVALTHSDARGLARGSITDRDGTLIASVTQESLWRI